ncbi:MAG: hypothetical protein PHE84_07030 [bacterium]|nr:hypothetical protein [bacterium]
MKKIITFLVILFILVGFSITIDPSGRLGFAASSAIETQALDQPIFSCFGNKRDTTSPPADTISHDTWTPTSTGANVPSGREYHTAVWTDSEMIVWGGEDVGGVTDTGGRYNPVTDSWTPTSTGANVPSGREYHTAVWAGTKMIVWGGYGDGLLNTGGIYTP